MNTSISILFYIKRAKAKKIGICPIYTRVTITAKRFEFSTNKYINPDQWSSEGSKVKGTTEETRTINSLLDHLKNKVLEAEKKFFKKDTSLNTENAKNELFGLSETKRMLVPIFQDHNNKIKELVGKECAIETLESYATSLKHTIELIQWKYNVSDIDIFITGYEFWLRSVRNCTNNTAVKYIKNFSKIVKISLANDWMDYLYEKEIQIIINKGFKTERL